MIRFADLFCGIGGFRLGFEQAGASGFTAQNTLSQEGCEDVGRTRQGYNEASRNKRHSGQPSQVGFRCIWSNDNDKYACQIYRNWWGDNAVAEGDIRDIDSTGMPDFDLLCGGFPCQSFSVAGRGRGFDDTRGTLFFEIARVLADKRPRYFLLENVKGLLSNDSGKTFSTILGVLTDLGYGIQWQVLNSKDFGVPQNRERVFIVGHLRGQPRPKVFPIRTDNAGATEGASETASVRTLQGGGHSGGHHSGMTLVHTAYPDGMREYTGVSPTISTPSGSGHLPYVLDDYNSRIKTDGIVPAIRQTNASNALGNASKLIDGATIRRLTPLECERLQGFPDGWTEGISDTQRYKCLGNAVTVNVIEAIGKKLLNELRTTS